MKEHAIIGFNHGLLHLAKNPALGAGFICQNTLGYALSVLTPKANPSGWVFSQARDMDPAQQPLIKTSNMSCYCNSFDFRAGQIARVLRRECSFSSTKSNKLTQTCFALRDANVWQREFPVGFPVEVSALNSLFIRNCHDVFACIESTCVIKAKHVLLVC